MNNLFERFLGRLLRESAPPGCEVLCQCSLGGYYNRQQKQISPLNPDYQVLRRGQRYILADAKYKLYGERRVSRSDLYQLPSPMPPRHSGADLVEIRLEIRERIIRLYYQGTTA